MSECFFFPRSGPFVCSFFSSLTSCDIDVVMKSLRGERTRARGLLRYTNHALWFFQEKIARIDRRLDRNRSARYQLGPVADLRQPLEVAYEAVRVDPVFNVIEQVVTRDVAVVRTSDRAWKPRREWFGVADADALAVPGNYYVVPDTIDGLQHFLFGGLTDVEVLGVSVRLHLSLPFFSLRFFVYHDCDDLLNCVAARSRTK